MGYKNDSQKEGRAQNENGSHFFNYDILCVHFYVLLYDYSKMYRSIIIGAIVIGSNNSNHNKADGKQNYDKQQ